MAKTAAFDERPQEYDAWFAQNDHVYQSELRAVRHLLPDSGEGLEVGVGTGRFAHPLGIRVGVEPSEPMRRLARSRGIEVHDTPAEALPFAQARFDFVLMVTTICFLDDPGRAFGEVWRVLRDSGVFVVGLVDSASPLGQVYNSRKSESPFYREATFHSADEVLSLLRRTGFVDAQAVQTVFGPLAEIRELQGFRDGHGEGGFVVIRASKPSSRVSR